MESKTKTLFLILGVAATVMTARGAPIVIDHRHTDITQLTEAQITRAKEVLHIAYGHTSHGSQLIDR